MTTKESLLEMALEQVYRDGKAAFQAGSDLSACPWRGDQYRSWWRQGWYDAQTDAGQAELDE